MNENNEPISSRAPQQGNINTNLNLSDTTKAGLIQVIFNADPALKEWLAQKLFDAHVEQGGDSRTIVVANATEYKCPICKRIYRKNISPAYAFCKGTEEQKHELVLTIPLDWEPLLTSQGFQYVAATIDGISNKNISTANFNLPENKNKNISKDYPLIALGYSISTSIVFQLVNDYEHMFNPKIIANFSIANKFTSEFIEQLIEELTYNIYATLSKGVRMRAVEEMAENKLEQTIRNESNQPNRQSGSIGITDSISKALGMQR